MPTKLKIQIDLHNSMEIDAGGKLIEEYSVGITFLDKDERFNADNMGDTYRHNGSGTFVIKTMWDEKMGSIIHNGIIMPSMDKLGQEHKRTFQNDLNRYHYLKKLYVAIGEWANYWWGFKYDDKSNITVNDNIWEVTCDTIYTGSMRYLDSPTLN